MKNRPEMATRLAGFGIVLLIAVGIVGPFVLAGGKGSGIPQGTRYHAGESVAPVPTDKVCQAKGCHGVAPHKSNPSRSTFHNMHQSYTDCLSCHGKDATRQWVARRNGSKWAIGYPMPPGTAEPHTVLVAPLSCRACHSESGRDILTRKGFGMVPRGFENPVALKMLEEGSKRWVPGDLR